MEPRICKIPVSKSECEDKRITHCIDCPYHEKCDYYWVSELWLAENKKYGKNSLLGPCVSSFLKPDFRANHVLTFTGQYDFCCFNIPRSKDYIIIGDIYVDEKARGQGLSKKILNYLMEKYDKDIFAKCVKGTSAEDFWSHVGHQINANMDNIFATDMYEHRPGKRDLGWYIVENKNKKAVKEDLF